MIVLVGLKDKHVLLFVQAPNKTVIRIMTLLEEQNCFVLLFSFMLFPNLASVIKPFVHKTAARFDKIIENQKIFDV